MKAFDRPEGRRPLSPIRAWGTKIREGEPGHGTMVTGSIRARELEVTPA